MTAYYNEFDPFAAQWLRNLIAAGLIPQGDVDDRSIVDVRGSDLRGYEQCHFFAGIGGWPYALQLAGWEGPVWTGSCPCQPFSVAGAGAGESDERHLWPEFRRLIAECRPEFVFGEQVESEDGLLWLAGVHLDMEEEAYAFGTAVLPAAGIGAPHARHRIYWVAERLADAGRQRIRGEGLRQTQSTPASREGTDGERQRLRADAGAVSRLADGDGRRREQRDAKLGEFPEPRPNRADGGLADHDHDGPYRTGGVATFTDSDEQDGRVHRGSPGGVEHASCDRGPSGLPGPQQGQERYAGVPDYTGGQRATWLDFTVIECGDGKYRRIPVEPAFFPLVDGPSPGRVGILRGAGNAIVPPLAAEFVQAFMEIDAR